MSTVLKALVGNVQAAQRIKAMRTNVQTGIDDGVTCPCCGQFAKVYKRQITGSAAAALIRLYHEAQLDFAHAPSIVGGRVGGEFARMAYWNLIEPDADKHSGLWRVTDRGLDFITKTATVARYAHIYDGTLQGFSGPQVSIVDSLGVKFDYRELMSR